MTSNRPLAHALIHHIALRVADAKASKDSFLTKLDFCVDREFSFGGMDFVWLYPAEGDTPVIELIGGELPASRPPYENDLESLGVASKIRRRTYKGRRLWLRPNRSRCRELRPHWIHQGC